MARYAIFYKNLVGNESNYRLAKLARNDEVRNYYYSNTEIFQSFVISEEQWLQVLKSEKLITLNSSKNIVLQDAPEGKDDSPDFVYLNESRFISAKNSDIKLFKEFLSNRKSSDADYSYWQNAINQLENLNITNVNWSNNYKYAVHVYISLGLEPFNGDYLP